LGAVQERIEGGRGRFFADLAKKLAKIAIMFGVF
jgi:hypothetical protein